MIRKTIILLIAVFIGISFAGLAAPIKGGKKVYLESKGKKYSYWFLAAKKDIEYRFSGILKVEISIRTEAGKKTNVFLGFDKEKVETVYVDEKASTASKVSVFKNVSKPKTMKMTIPKGKHKISISADNDIIVRVTTQKPKSYVSMAPQKHAGGIVLVSNEEEYAYYRASMDKAVEYSVIGEGTVTLYTRLIYSQGMLGNQHYRVSVQIDGDEPTIYEFETEASPATYFRGDGKVIPGKAKKIQIKVPAGRHTIKILPANSAAIAVRMMMPKSMLK